VVSVEGFAVASEAPMAGGALAGGVSGPPARSSRVTIVFSGVLPAENGCVFAGCFARSSAVARRSRSDWSTFGFGGAVRSTVGTMCTNLTLSFGTTGVSAAGDAALASGITSHTITRIACARSEIRTLSRTVIALDMCGVSGR
jgi:hypothetical protein